MYNFRTDLADERRDLYKKANNVEELEKVYGGKWSSILDTY